jgi:hypothetical protein
MRPALPQPLYDSSAFNYDSEDEQDEQQQAVEESSAERQAATAAAAAQQQQQRRGRALPAMPARDAESSAGPAGAAEAEQEQPVEIVLPPPRGVRVKSAEFIKSSADVSQCPPARFPEFAGQSCAHMLSHWPWSFLTLRLEEQPFASPAGAPAACKHQPPLASARLHGLLIMCALALPCSYRPLQRGQVEPDQPADGAFQPGHGLQDARSAGGALALPAFWFTSRELGWRSGCLGQQRMLQGVVPSSQGSIRSLANELDF